MSDKIEIGIRLEYLGKTTNDWDEMIRRIDSVAREYGCKVRQYGPWSEMKRSATEEAEFINTIIRHTSGMPDNVPGTGWVTLGGSDEDIVTKSG